MQSDNSPLIKVFLSLLIATNLLFGVLNRSGEIVADSTTGLQWQDNEIVKTTSGTWQKAIDYCENTLALGGHNDWRMPNKIELLSIADRSRFNPAIDDTVFVNTSSSNYWSSTTDAGYTGGARFVNFYQGYTHSFAKATPLLVRCVRGGQFDDFGTVIPIFTNISLPYKEAVKPETFNLYITEIIGFNASNLSVIIDGSAVSVLETSTADSATGLKLAFEGTIANTGDHTIVLNYYGYEATITVSTVKNARGEPFRLAKQSGGYRVSRGFTSDKKFDIKVLDKSIVSLDPTDADPFEFHKQANMEGGLTNQSTAELLAYTDQSAGLLLGASTSLDVEVAAELAIEFNIPELDIGFNIPELTLEGSIFKSKISAKGFGSLTSYKGRFYYPSDKYPIAASIIPLTMSTIAPVGFTKVIAEQFNPDAFYKNIYHYGFDLGAAISLMDISVKPTLFEFQSDITSIGFSLINENPQLRCEWFNGKENDQKISLMRIKTETNFSPMAGNISLFKDESIFNVNAQNAKEFELGQDRGAYVLRAVSQLDTPIHYVDYPLYEPFVKVVDEYYFDQATFEDISNNFSLDITDTYAFTKPVLVKTWLRSDNVVKDYGFEIQAFKNTFGFSYQNSSYEDVLSGVSYRVGDKRYVIYANKVGPYTDTAVERTLPYRDYATNVLKTSLKESAADIVNSIKEKFAGLLKELSETVEEGWKVAKDGSTTVFKAWVDAPANIRFLWNNYSANDIQSYKTYSQSYKVYADSEPQQASINNANLTFHSDILDLNMPEGDTRGEVILYATYDPLTSDTGIYHYDFGKGQWIKIESQSQDGGLKFMATQGGYYALIDAFAITKDFYRNDLYSVNNSGLREIVSDPIYMSNGSLAINQEFNLAVTGSYSMVDGQLKMGVRPFTIPTTATSDENGQITLPVEAGANAGRATVSLYAYQGYATDKFDLVVLDESMTQPIENFPMNIIVPLKVKVGSNLTVEANIAQTYTDLNISIIAPNGRIIYGTATKVDMKGEWLVHLSAKDENGYEHTTIANIISELPSTTDLTLNGNNDIVWHQRNTGSVKVMEMSGLNVLEEITVVESSNTNLLPRGIADFTGEGKPDILFHNQNSGNLRIWEMDGTVKGENIQVLGSSNTNLKIAGVGDFDGDGDTDIATFNTNSGALRMWVMNGTTRVDNVLVLTGANVNLVPKGAGDMNNDGIPDIVLRNNNSGAVRVWTMNSDLTRKGNEYVIGSSNTNLELRGVMDINGDGNNDILNYNTNTGKLRAWLMDGNLSITENAEIVQDADLDWSVRN